MMGISSFFLSPKVLSLIGAFCVAGVVLLAASLLASYVARKVTLTFCEWKNLVEFWAWQGARKRARKGKQ